MKILFICGSLQPGCDGVGDYTRRLAAALISQGNNCCIISLNDRFIPYILSCSQPCNYVEVPVHRIPASLPEKSRFELAAKWSGAFVPDWISLQFVPYSFNKRGLPFTLPARLRLFGKAMRWHLMLHELWLGMEQDCSKRALLTGYLQMRIIKSLISTIKPIIIHTHSHIYQEQLAAIGVNSTILPLFPNIHSVSKSGLKSTDELKLVIFGAIHPHSQVADFTTELVVYAKENQLKPSLTIAGHSGSELHNWLQFWENQGIPVFIHAESSTQSISEILSKAHVGISTYPSLLAEKSSSVAAMLAHGLPVICIGKIWKPRIDTTCISLPGTVQFNKGNLGYCLAQRGSVKTPGALETATLFAESLSNFNT